MELVPELPSPPLDTAGMQVIRGWIDQYKACWARGMKPPDDAMVAAQRFAAIINAEWVVEAFTRAQVSHAGRDEDLSLKLRTCRIDECLIVCKRGFTKGTTDQQMCAPFYNFVKKTLNSTRPASKAYEAGTDYGAARGEVRRVKTLGFAAVLSCGRLT